MGAIKTGEENQLSLEKEEQNSQKIVSVFGGDKVLWEIKEIYQDHFDNIYDATTNQQLENQSLKERLVLQEQEKEINKFYIASLIKTNQTSQDDFQVLKIKNQELKKELRELKDRLLIIDAEQRMSRYFNQKNRKECKTVQEKKTMCQISKME